MLEQVTEQLLAPAEIGAREIDLALGRLTGGAVDWGDLYFQRSCSESWALEDGIVRHGAWDLNQGVGVRALAGERTGFAYADTIALPALLEAADSARSIARVGQSGERQVTTPFNGRALYAPIDPTTSHPSADKVDLLRTIDAYVRSLDTRIAQVSISLSTSHDTLLVAASDGTLAADIRPLVRLDVSVVLEENGRRERGNAGGGGRFSLDRLFAREFWQTHANEAVRLARVNFGAEPAPAGTMTVVLGSGWAGVLLHEAIGHGLEGDFNRRGTSAFSGRMGEQVATPACTVVDDGTLPERRGSLTIDDEGTPSGYNVLIENGRLTGYMQDKHNARLMGMKPTGNGRRESFAHLPMPRMTNTYMLPGEHDPEAIIASVDDGIYAVNFEGGQVDITSGKFVFCASEAYRIQRGKLGPALKGATLIGNGPDVLTRVSMVGNDLELDSGVGVCGKDGQGVPVGVGQPTMRVDGLTVGGTS